MNKDHILCLVILGCTCLAFIPRNTDAKVYEDKQVSYHLQEEHNERTQTETRQKRSKELVVVVLVVAVLVVPAAVILCLFICFVPPPDTTPPTVICPSIDPVYYIPDGGDSMVIDWGGDAAVQASDSNGIKTIKRVSPTIESGGHFPKKDNYELRYTAEDQAGNIASCVRQFSVKATTCPIANSPRHGSVTCNGSDMPARKGDRCHFECNMGYILENPAIATQTCTGENTENGQFIPAGAVFCTAIQCPVTLVPSNVTSYGCTNNFDVGSTCQYACSEGYMLEDESMSKTRTCEVDGSNPEQGSWSSPMIMCIDASAPVFTTCPDSFTVYVGDDFTTAYINYTLPTAIDNRGSTTAVYMTSNGISPGQSVAIDRENYGNNIYYVRYTSTDDHGIESHNPCLFTIFIKDLVCPLLEYQPRLITTCTEPLVIGANCTFVCDYGYQLVGLSEVHCARLEGDPPTAYWNWSASGNVTQCESNIIF